MKKPLPLLIYDKMSPRNKQRVNMACGALAMITVALVVSGMIGNGETRVPAPADLPKAKPVGFVPGGQLNPQDAWMGGAGKDVATLQSEVRERSSEIIRLRGDMTTMQQQFRAEMQAMAARMPGAGASPAPGAASSATPGFVIPPNPLPTPALNPMGAAAPTAPALTPGAGAVGTAQNQPASFPAQSRIGRPAGAGTPGSLAYPPGSPGMNNGGPSNGAGGLAGGVAGAAPSIGSAPSLMRVSMSDDSRTQSTKTSGAAAAAGVAAGPAGAGKAPRTLANFLPVGFTRAKLLGGLAAPTGGQAQGNPVPVFLRLEDLSYLPNGARAQVKDCLVIAEGFGDASAERAYIRTTLLSCVMRDGRVLEIPIKGAVFGEDGMNGMMGKLVTKQGAILGNALLAGVAAGIGSGIAQATQTVSSTTLGPVNSAPTDASGILKQGVGTGVGKALDRLAQYYINLAERMFPVIEVQPGRTVDIVIQQGVSIDVALSTLGAEVGPAPTRGGSADGDRSSLMRAVRAVREDSDD